MKFLIVFLLFLLLNTAKISVFNLLLTEKRNFSYKLYKFIFVFLTVILLKGSLIAYSFILLTVFYILEIVYLWIGISYFNFYHYFLHMLQGLKLLRESLGVVRYNAVPRNWNQLLALADLPLFIAVAVLLEQNSFSFATPYTAHMVIVCFALIFGLELVRVLRGQSLIQLIKNYPRSERQLVENYGTLVNMIVDACKFSRQDIIIKQFDYGKTREFKGKPGQFDGNKANKPNIILVQVESLDANAIRLSHNSKKVMPYLASLTGESIYYPYVLNYHKAGGTSDAEFSIINSVEPLSNYPSIKLSSYTYENSFVRLLADNSYHTAVFHGNKGSYYQRDKAFAQMGFNKFYDLKAMDLRHVGWGAPDHQVFAYVLEKMKEQTEPFFYYIITMSSHCRFTNVLNYYENKDFQDVKNTDLKNFYNSLSYVDAQLKSFISRVCALKPDTNIIILGDHTPGLKKIYREASLSLKGRHLEFVPLFVLTPDGLVYKENQKTASFLDIAPTVIELANIEALYTTYGESLIPPNELKEKIPYRNFFFDREKLRETFKSVTVN